MTVRGLHILFSSFAAVFTLLVCFFLFPLPVSAQTTPRVSLLWEADTTTHPFYRGRALPSANASVRVFADAQFTSGGSSLADQSLTYTWTINGRVMQNLSGEGRQSLSLSGPVLFGALVVSVEVRSPNGALRASRTVRIAAEEPIVNLYENNPLAGVLYRNALANGMTLRGTGAGLIAVPFFLSPSLDPRSISYEWKLGGKAAPADVGRPYALTLEGEDRERVDISLSIKHAQKSFQSASRSWRLFLSNASSESPFNFTQ